MQRIRNILVEALVQCSLKSANFDGNWIKALIFCRDFSVDLPKAFLRKLPFPAMCYLAVKTTLAIMMEIYFLVVFHSLSDKWKL